MKIKDLKGKDLSVFSLWEMTEIYKVNEKEEFVESRGFLTDSKLAETLAEKQPDSDMWRTRKGWVLNNGDKGLVIQKSTDAVMLSESKVKKEIKKMIIDDLSLTEKKILGLETE